MTTFYEALRQNDRLFPLLRMPGIGTGGFKAGVVKGTAPKGNYAMFGLYRQNCKSNYGPFAPHRRNRSNKDHPRSH